MGRSLKVAAAQLGPIHLADPREAVVERLVALLREAHGVGAKLVVFPELALTTFFPRYFMEDQAEVDRFFEREMPSPATQPLFDEAKQLGIGFHLGYAELDGERHFNTAILVDENGELVGKYRKIHLPGHADHRPQSPFQHLEKRYFEVGDLGFNVWRAFGGVVGMCICNDRRWPETFRVMGLQGVEMVVLGYNTPRGQYLPPRAAASQNVSSLPFAPSRCVSERYLGRRVGQSGRRGWTRPHRRLGDRGTHG